MKCILCFAALLMASLLYGQFPTPEETVEGENINPAAAIRHALKPLAKKKIMRECGIHVVDSPAQIGQKMAELVGVTA